MLFGMFNQSQFDNTMGKVSQEGVKIGKDG